MTFASDNFNRANGALGSDWASFFGGITVSSNTALGGSLVSAARWTTATFGNDHWSEATIVGFTSGVSYPGVAVRLDASGNGYYIAIDSGNAYVQRLTGGVEFAIATRSTAWANGDVMRLEVVGTDLKVFKNGVQVGTDVASGGLYTSGQPGLFCYGAATVDAWSADDGVPVGPVITVQPTDQTVNAAATATFTITATGGTLSYQWKKNGSNVGTNSATYSHTGTAYSDNGAAITCDVTDAGGTTVSDTARIRVAFNLSGSGPRTYSLFGGGPFGAGAFGDYVRNTISAAGATGTLATTNNNDSSTATGTTTVRGSLARINANDTSTTSGTITVVGTVARTNTGDTSTASGSPILVGTVSRTNTNDTSTASGTVGSVSGTVNQSNNVDTSSASGTTTILGVFSRTNVNDSIVASGIVITNGTLSRTNTNDTIVSFGSPISNGAINSVNVDDTCAASGDLGVSITGTLEKTNQNDTMLGSGSSGSSTSSITTRIPLTGAGV